MEKALLKEGVDKIMKAEGEALGVAVKSGFEYTLYRKGKEGLKKIEDVMEELGYPIKYKEINPMDFYPVGFEIAIFLVMQEIFDFNEDDFVELGERESKLPLIIRLFMRHLGSIKMLAQEGPKMWRKYYSIGALELTDFNEGERYAVVRIEGIDLHPVHCGNLKGYLKGIVKMVGKKDVTCQEIKCIYRGDEYHEFMIRWQ